MGKYPYSLRSRVVVYLSRKFSRSNGDPGVNYGVWFDKREIWQNMRWLGVPVQKFPGDLWNYQEILTELKPSLVVEFGANAGGSALYFSQVLRGLGRPYRVFSVDITHEMLQPRAREDDNITFYESSSTNPQVAEEILAWRSRLPGPVFAILDSYHTKEHVLAEMKLMRPLLRSGDYMVVEDGVVNGHPLWPGWGEGPYEAIEEYVKEYPGDYVRDKEREEKFGFTFAPTGYLKRR